MKEKTNTQIIKLDNNIDHKKEIVDIVKGQIQSKAKIFVGDKEIKADLWIEVLDE